MDELCLRAVGGNGGDGFDLGISHNDGVALHMAKAGGVAHHPGIKDLVGGVLRH